jgi:hypothetical protein
VGIKQSTARTTPRLDLGAALMEIMVNRNEFIGTQALAVFNTQLKAGTFNAITRECLTKVPETKRASSGAYNRIGAETEEISFSCEEHGLENPLGDDKRAFYARDFDAELVCTMQTLNLILLAQEIRIATALFNTSTWTGSSLYTDVSSSAPWDAVDSDVISQIRTAKEKVRQLTGLRPNALIIGETNLNRLKANAGIKGSIQYVEKLTDEALHRSLADLFGIRNILVGGAVKNTANKGKAFSGQDVWSDDYAMVAVIAEDRNDLATPAVGRTMLWSEDSEQNPVVEEYRDETVRGDVFRVRHSVAEKIVDPSFAHLLKVD